MPSEIHSILEGKTVDENRSFFSTFKDIVSIHRKKTAIVYEDDLGFRKSISFGHMDRLSNQMANLLLKFSSQSNFGRNSIAISLRPTEKLPVILLAIMKSGMSYLPLDIEYPRERVDHILRESLPLMCIIDSSAVDAEWYKGVKTVTDQQLISQATKERIELEVNQITDNAAILYTSGSTGLPKGVQLPYSAVMNRLRWQWRILPYQSDEEFCISKTALTFVDSICEIWGPLLQGRTLVIVSKSTTKNPEKLTEVLEEFKIQRLVLVPSLLKCLLTHLRMQGIENSLNNLKLWICSGETLQITLAVDFFNWFKSQHKTLANFYGSTEVMGDVSYFLVEERDEVLRSKSIPIGQPIDNCKIYLVDESLNLVKAGEVGEMLVAGKNLAKGYISDDKATRFLDNPFSRCEGFTTIFRTGDYARIIDRKIFYEGRRDNQVKVRGHRVDLSEIERVVLNMELVKDAAVLPIEVASGSEVIVCFIVPIRNHLDERDIERGLRSKLPDYMMPEWILIDQIPLLISGKVDRIRLVQHYVADGAEECRRNCRYDYTGIPSRHLKKAEILFPIIASVTGLKGQHSIDYHSNFYDLGGNSLNSVQTVLKLRENGYHIGITDFISAKSLRDVLDKMKYGDSPRSEVETDGGEGIELEMLNQSHKNYVIRMITDSFFKKADLERWLIPHVKDKDYFDLMQELWRPLVEANLSFVLKKRSTREVLSVALNFDAYNEPDIIIKSKLVIIFDFLEYLERPIRESSLPQGRNKIFHTFMMATNDQLSMAENVLMIKIMEQKCIEVAKNKKFIGILTTNTSPLTQQLGEDVFHYDTLLDYQVNQYVTPDGMRPFAQAPDEQRAVVAWKSIDP